jgi:hypothetical protein
MEATLKKMAAVTVSAILVLALAAVPAQAAGPRHEALRAGGPSPLTGGWNLGAWLLDWLGLGAGARPDGGLTRITAAGGAGMDPNGTPTASGGGGMDPDGTPTVAGGVGMDPNG